MHRAEIDNATCATINAKAEPFCCQKAKIFQAQHMIMHRYVFFHIKPAFRFCFHGNKSAVFEVYLAECTQFQEYKAVARQKFLRGPQVEKPCPAIKIQLLILILCNTAALLAFLFSHSEVGLPLSTLLAQICTAPMLNKSKKFWWA